MSRKLHYILALVIMLASIPAISQAQDKEKTEEHHTGVKRTYHKAKTAVKRTWRKTKATTKTEYNKAKVRVKSDDTKEDNNERK